jgi:hypothetical protein
VCNRQHYLKGSNPSHLDPSTDTSAKLLPLKTLPLSLGSLVLSSTPTPILGSLFVLLSDYSVLISLDGHSLIEAGVLFGRKEE